MDWPVFSCLCSATAQVATEHLNAAGALEEGADRLVDVAAGLLSDPRMFLGDGPVELIRLALSRQDQLAALQEPSKFSDLQLTLYRCDRLVVELLFWWTGTTSIHDHAFCGAFKVVHGSSLHAEYTFEASYEESVNFSVGRLKGLGAGILAAGDIKRIDPGRRFIHAAFHLDSPSVTLVARSPVQPALWPQYEYRGGRICVNSNELPLWFLKEVQGLRIMARLDAGEFVRCLQRKLEVANVEELYWLRRSLDSEIEQAGADGLFLALPGFAPIADGIRREKAIARLVALRRTTTNASNRFLIAMLMNLGDPVLWSQAVQSARDKGMLGAQDVGRLTKVLAGIASQVAPHQPCVQTAAGRLARLLFPLLADPTAQSESELWHLHAELVGIEDADVLMPLLLPPNHEVTGGH